MFWEVVRVMVFSFMCGVCFSEAARDMKRVIDKVWPTKVEIARSGTFAMRRTSEGGAGCSKKKVTCKDGRWFVDKERK